MSTPDRNGIDIEAILGDIYASEISASISSWLWDGGIDVKGRLTRSPRPFSGSGIRLAPCNRTANSRENMVGLCELRLSKRRKPALSGG
jgi:hypothetical protein